MENKRGRPMKIRASAFAGRTLMSAEGQMVGIIQDVVADTKTGQLHHVLVIPNEEVDPRYYKTDSQGRLVLPFDAVTSVRDVVVMDVK